MIKFLIDQDREKAVLCPTHLSFGLMFLDTTLIGISLFASGLQIGSFESLGELLIEVENMRTCKESYYYITQFEEEESDEYTFS